MTSHGTIMRFSSGEYTRFDWISLRVRERKEEVGGRGVRCRHANHPHGRSRINIRRFAFPRRGGVPYGPFPRWMPPLCEIYAESFTAH